MEREEYLLMDDAGNIREEDFTTEMNAAVNSYLEDLDDDCQRQIGIFRDDEIFC